ncbi:HAD family hydrolase [bacterium]|nr:HAD family hydrolase [candidate division CSSED10-310 bacterium]
MNRDLALFDFDGTITRRDTLLDFMIFSIGKPRAIGVFIRLLPSVFAFLTKRITNQQLKETFLLLSFQGMEERSLRQLADEYSKKRLPKLLRPTAMERIEWHKAAGHHIVIVSASADTWLERWCQNENLDLICSHLETKDGRITGRLLGLNCRGPEKVRRIQQHLNLENYEKIYAYGDSRGDREMLDLADEGEFRLFH